MPPCGTDWVRIKRLTPAADGERPCLDVVDLRRFFGAGVSGEADFQQSLACTTQNIQMHSDASNTSRLNDHLCSCKLPLKVCNCLGMVGGDMA